MLTKLTKRRSAAIVVERFEGGFPRCVGDVVAVEEPLEMQLTFREGGARRMKPISVTMRTPGNDSELALGFLYSEGVIRDVGEVACVTSSDERRESVPDWTERRQWPAKNMVKVDLANDVEVNLAALQRNFYTTSSCGVCGKASLMALRTVCPPRSDHRFQIDADLLHHLHAPLRNAQEIFRNTGGIHSAALFSADGTLLRLREDVGRHNALDKIVGASLFEDELPLRDRLLLLSGRASFELMQKAVMTGIPMVAAVGAPSSLAVALAREFDVTLIGFLREDHFNVYHGAQRLAASGSWS